MKWRKITKWISRITTTVLFTVLILTAIMVITSKASGGEPGMFGYQLKTVLSGSMEPGIQTGSIISVKPGGDMTRFEKGDVITFMADEQRLVTHRIVEMKNDGNQYITKGDNNEEADTSPVLAQNVVGVYTGFTIPYVGYAIDFANSKGGSAVLLILPGILLLGYSIYTTFRAVKELDGKKNEETTASAE